MRLQPCPENCGKPLRTHLFIGGVYHCPPGTIELQDEESRQGDDPDLSGRQGERASGGGSLPPGRDDLPPALSPLPSRPEPPLDAYPDPGSPYPDPGSPYVVHEDRFHAVATVHLPVPPALIERIGRAVAGAFPDRQIYFHEERDDVRVGWVA